MTDPNDTSEFSSAKFHQGDELWVEGNTSGAFKAYSEALIASPESSLINNRLAAFMLAKVAACSDRSGDVDGSISAWRAFLAIDPDNLRIHRILGLSLFLLGRAKEAEQYLVPLLRTQSQDTVNEISQSLADIVKKSKIKPDALAYRYLHIESLVAQVPAIATTMTGLTDEVLVDSTPVCVAGMHRSGTSLVTRVLAQIGVHPGMEAQLVSPQADNPEGFYEYAPIASLNELLLSALGGGWDTPPDFNLSMLGQESLILFKARAKLLAASIAACAPNNSVWGWKDPRNSLTLPFWLDVFPNMRVVVVVRDPGDVAYSLRQRGGYHTIELGLNLWRTYYERIFSALAEKKFHVIRYESVFEQPDVEIERLGRFLGVNVDDDLKSRARSSIRPYLRHNVSKVDWRALPAGKALLPAFERLTTLASIS